MTTTPIQTIRKSAIKTAPITQRTIRNTVQEATHPRFLVIGYGNELRGDDAAGPKVAMSVAKWQLSAVQALAVHQLMPDLANDVSRADYVIFVDACYGEHCSRTVQLEPIVGKHIPPFTSP